MAGQNEREFRILSIDGGGIRGLIPATLLACLEESIAQPLWKYFDLICGTSTGGIIALAIAIDKPIKEIKELYDTKAPDIFPPLNQYDFYKRILRCRRILFGNGGRYNSDALEQILKKEFEMNGQNLKMKDAHTRLCIPSIDITNGTVVIYKTPHKVRTPKEEIFNDDADNYVWEVARATSAAPTFFKTVQIKNSYFVDGGMWANNPSLVGVVEAIRCGFDLQEINLLSLGTGNTIFQVEQDKAKNMNLTNWGKSGLIELSFEVQSQAVHNEVNCLLSTQKYLRVQYNFKKNIALDDISRLGDLKGAAQHLYRNFEDEIKRRYLTSFSKNLNYKEG